MPSPIHATHHVPALCPLPPSGPAPTLGDAIYMRGGTAWYYLLPIQVGERLGAWAGWHERGRCVKGCGCGGCALLRHLLHLKSC